ncbi:hypothetical protein C8R45DRAFT_965915 [Mycena sanguinolenta]|nr:hypothetical protein C8R45DRAFT_965915 [Mycena sanguinolenta]
MLRLRIASRGKHDMEASKSTTRKGQADNGTRTVYVARVRMVRISRSKSAAFSQSVRIPTPPLGGKTPSGTRLGCSLPLVPAAFIVLDNAEPSSTTRSSTTVSAEQKRGQRSFRIPVREVLVLVVVLAVFVLMLMLGLVHPDAARCPHSAW